MTSETPVEELSSILTQAGKQKAKRKGPPKGAIDPEFGKRLPEDRRIVMVVRQRSGKRGKGANGTRVAIAMAETATAAESILATYAAIPESYLNTDSSPAYSEVGKAFLAKLAASDADRREFADKVIMDPFRAFIGYAVEDSGNSPADVKEFEQMLTKMEKLFVAHGSPPSVRAYPTT